MRESINKSVERKILLNPGPATTSARVKEALVVEDICPREKEFGELIQGVAGKAKRVVNANKEYECVLLGASGSGAIEACLSSCVDKDDGILIVENGAYGKRMGQICDVLGIRSETLRFDWDQQIDVQRVDDFIIQHSFPFRTLAFVHHETTSGILNPFSLLREVAIKHGMVSLVDAMSSYAGIPIDLTEEPVDYLISSSNKCIQGMAGVGIVIAKLAELEATKDFYRRSFYFDLYKNFISQKEAGQFCFTPPVQILYALNEALDEFFDEGGVTARAKRYQDLYRTMFDGMCRMGFAPLLEESCHSKILTTFLEPSDPNYQFDDMHGFLYERGFTIYPGKIGDRKSFRISNIGQLSVEDLESFLGQMNEYLTTRGICIK